MAQGCGSLPVRGPSLPIVDYDVRKWGPTWTIKEIECEPKQNTIQPALYSFARLLSDIHTLPGIQVIHFGRETQDARCGELARSNAPQ
jgi:hypothetical protein